MLNDALYSFALRAHHQALISPALLQSNTQQINAHYAVSICRLLFPTIVAGNNSHDAVLEHRPIPKPFVSFRDLTV